MPEIEKQNLENKEDLNGKYEEVKEAFLNEGNILFEYLGIDKKTQEMGKVLIEQQLLIQDSKIENFSLSTSKKEDIFKIEILNGVANIGNDWENKYGFRMSMEESNGRIFFVRQRSSDKFPGQNYFHLLDSNNLENLRVCDQKILTALFDLIS